MFWGGGTSIYVCLYDNKQANRPIMVLMIWAACLLLCGLLKVYNETTRRIILVNTGSTGVLSFFILGDLRQADRQWHCMKPQRHLVVVGKRDRARECSARTSWRGLKAGRRREKWRLSVIKLKCLTFDEVQVMETRTETSPQWKTTVIVSTSLQVTLQDNSFKHSFLVIG